MPGRPCDSHIGSLVEGALVLIGHRSSQSQADPTETQR